MKCECEESGVRHGLRVFVCVEIEERRCECVKGLRLERRRTIIF